jgi:hypothetical protein
MTHMTKTQRTRAPRGCSQQRRNAARPIGMSSAVTGRVAPRVFALRKDHAVSSGNRNRGRAFPKGEDS